MKGIVVMKGMKGANVNEHIRTMRQIMELDPSSATHSESWRKAAIARCAMFILWHNDGEEMRRRCKEVNITGRFYKLTARVIKNTWKGP